MMKKYNSHSSNCSLAFLLLLISSFFFTNCEKPLEDLKGKAIAEKSGILWTSDCISNYSKIHPEEIYIKMRTYSSEGFLRENLHIGRIIPIKGKFTIIKSIYDTINQELGNYSSSYSTLKDDGDVMDNFYHVLETENNNIEVSNVNLETMTISGKFNISYVNSDTLGVPDTIRFFNGEFQTQIKEN